MKIQSELLSQCQSGLQRLYFDLKTVLSFLQAIETHYPILNYFLSPDYLYLHNKGLRFIKEGQVVYQAIQNKLGMNLTSEDLLKINQTLNQAYQIRTDLFGFLQQICDHKDLCSIDAKLDCIHINIENGVQIKDSNRLNFEDELKKFFTDTLPTHFKDLLDAKKLNPAQNAKISNDLIAKVVPDFFDENYSLAYRWQSRILLLTTWMNKIDELLTKSPDLQQNTPLSLTQAVQLQNILCNQKSAFFIGFYTHAKHYHNSVLTGLYTRMQTDANPKKIIEQLEQYYKVLLNNLNKKELKLKQYSWTQAIMAGVIRVPFNSAYYLLSESLMRLGEEITQTTTLQQVPILNEKLSEEYIMFFSSIGGLLMFGLDYYVSTRLTGMSYASLNALTQTMLTDLTPLLSITNHLGGDEQSVVEHLPKLHWLVGLSVHLGFHALLFGLSSGNIGFFTISYCCATLARRLVGAGFDAGKAYDKVNHFSQSMPRGFALIKGISQGLGYSASSYLCYQYRMQIDAYFTTPEQSDLLSNEEICQIHAKDCQKAALSRLELPEDATFKQVKSRWYKLSKELHPDTFLHSNLPANEKTARNEAYMEFAQAYERLEKLTKHFNYK